MGIHIKSVTGSVVIEQRGEHCKVWIFEDGFITNDGLLNIDYATINESVAMMTADQAITHLAGILQASKI